jgi:hypothetical protein
MQEIYIAKIKTTSHAVVQYPTAGDKSHIVHGDASDVHMLY